MKKIILVAVFALIAGCSNEHSAANFPSRPPELADCKIFNLRNETGGHITIARCPNSSTTVQSGGKTKTTAVLIDGVEYVRAN